MANLADGDIQRLPGEGGASNSAVRRRVEIHRDKLANLGELTVGVAHEMNNTVGYIASNLGTLRRYCDTLVALIDRVDGHIDVAHRARWQAELGEARWNKVRSDLTQLITETRHGADHLKQVVGALRLLARSAPTLEECTLDECVKSGLTVLGHLLKHRCAVQRRLEAVRPFPMIRAQITQVAVNLVHNAVQSLGENGGTVRISTMDHKDRVELMVEDSGPGVPEELREHIFIPYFTTRPNGTGLGLAIARQVAASHGGTLHCDGASDLGGARFVLILRSARSSRAETQVDL